MRTHQGEGRYSGAALNSFLLGLGHSEALVKKVLTDAGVDSIDPERWYEINWAIGIYFSIAEKIGRGAIIEVGKKMIEAAAWPPGVDKDIKSLLGSLDTAYRMAAEGPNIGEIRCEFHDDESATLVWTSMGPCALNIGIMQGCCSKLGIQAVVEHAPGECMDDGGSSCTYFLSL